MNQQNQAFCNVHEDHIIQMVCLDYSTQSNYRMCKKCNKEFNHPGNIEENLIQTNNLLQQEFEQIFFNSRPTIQPEEYCAKFQHQITQILRRVPELFSEVVNRLKRPQQSEESIKEHKKFYNTEQIAIKQDLNNFIYNQLDVLENTFFSYDVIQNQELFILPSNQEILSTMDGNSLLRKYEQIFIHQYKLFNEEELMNHINQKLQNKERMRNQSQQVRQNTHQIIERIEAQINQQKNEMVRRIIEKEQILQENLQRIIQFLDHFDVRDFQIQEAQNFTEIIQIEQVPIEIEQLAQRQLISQSRICHVGRIDVRIPISEIQERLCINYIPIRRQENAVIIPQIQYPNIFPDPTQCNQEKLFNIDLSKYFNTNIFDYTIIENKVGITYRENSQPCRWEYSKLRQNDTYTLLLNLEARGTIQINDIRVDGQGNVNFNNNVTLSSDNLTYIGQLNQLLQYHGQGVLTQNNIIKTGQWENGLQHGQGTVQRRVNNQNQLIYEGEFQRGLYHGKGVLWRRVDQQVRIVYEGDFQKGQFHGFGTLYYRDNYQYHGNFVNGLREGQGKIKKLINNDPDPKVIESAEWRQDFPVSEECSIF